MGKKLTDLLVKNAKAPKGGRLVIADTEVRGLSLRVSKHSKSWLIRYRVKGETERDAKGKPKQRVEVPGAYPFLPLAEARQRARDVIAAAKRGTDLPAQEKREGEARQRSAATARTVRELASEYIEKHCKTQMRTWKQAEQRLNNHVLPKLGNKSAAEVRRADIVEVLDDIEHRKGLRQQVNRTRVTLSAMFAYAIEREYVTENPVAGTRARKMENDRSRTLTDDELKAIWGALDTLPEPGRSFVRTLMLTATRRDETRGLRWDELSDDGTVWMLPAERNKAQRDFEIPLSLPMRELLEAIKKERTKAGHQGPYVFTVNGEGMWWAHDKFKVALDKASGVTGWVYHDIRRTVRSRLAELHISYEIAERVLNHAMTRLERIYNRHAYFDEKAKALQTWADHLLFIVGKRSPNVVELRAGR